MANNIEDFAIERGIKSLLHFTQKTNLKSILEHGLVVRNKLTPRSDSVVFNDQIRLDHTDAICTTIGFPNYKLFFGLRQSNPGIEWAIVVIKPSALWKLECAFCRENAAASAVTEIPLLQRKSLDSFKTMFTDFGDKNRITLRLPDFMTTNPQAEVLFLNGIPKNYILGVIVPNIYTLISLEKAHPDVTFKCLPKYFSPRSDYVSWKKINM